MLFLPRRGLWRAVFGSLPATLFWLLVCVLLMRCLPERAWLETHHTGVVSLGLIGLWRTGWFLLNAARSFYYTAWRFPLLRQQADALPTRFPRRLYVVIASYKESPKINRLCFPALVAACGRIPSAVTLVVSVGGQEEADAITALVEGCPGAERLQLVFLFQSHGKRLALGYALRAVSRRFHDLREWHADAGNDIVVLMDGDTAVGEDVFEKCLPFFRLYPDLGGLTNNEIPVVFRGSSWLIAHWYDLKMAKRHLALAGQSLDRRVATLTGRFSVFRAEAAVSQEFIEFLDRDHLHHWAHGQIRFLMGDDKSTQFYLLKNGWEMLYVPDSYVYCLEDRSQSFFKLAPVLMLRWYGNMLRNNGRSLALGPTRMPLSTWLVFLDQRISMWTSLIGPVAALILSVTTSLYFLPMYALWVGLSRLAQLWALVLGGHRLQIVHLPLVIFEQWYGSTVKIYCSFNLQHQIWQKARAEAQSITGGRRGPWLPRFGLVFAWLLLVLGVCLTLGVLRLPPLF